MHVCAEYSHRLPLLSSLRQGGYNHYMEKEIFEQAETIAQTMQVPML